MTLTFDPSERTTVVVCSVCGWRDVVVGGRAEANQLADRHQLRAHPGDKRMAAQIDKRKQRGRG